MNDLINRLSRIEDQVGNTRLFAIEHANCIAHVKIEATNFSGSIKDRPAVWIIKDAIRKGIVNAETTLVESSSGNFAIALARSCAFLKITFIPVIDPNVTPSVERALRLYCKRVEKVDVRDKTGGYLLTRLAHVQVLCASIKNSYWPNQYENISNFESYRDGMSPEIHKQLPQLDYVFVAVSTCGTVAGLSTGLKGLDPHVQVVAVDVVGSVVFGGLGSKRRLNGLGASMSPPQLQRAKVDHILLIEEPDIIRGCRELVHRHGLHAGASTGAAWTAINRYFEKPGLVKPKVLFIAADSGMNYMETVYDETWVIEAFGAAPIQ